VPEKFPVLRQVGLSAVTLLEQQIVAQVQTQVLSPVVLQMGLPVELVLASVPAQLAGWPEHA
jgi:hypothetical protein